MESYLVDEQVLGDIVDALIKEKYPDDPIENHQDIRRDAIKSLDHQIVKSIIGKLTKDEGAELNRLLNENTEDPSVFDEFFEKHNIDLQATITDAMVSFKNQFLKGDENA